MPSSQRQIKLEIICCMLRLLSSPVWSGFKDRRVSHEGTAEHDKLCRLTRNRSSTGDQHRMRPLSQLVFVNRPSCSPYWHACYCTAAHLTAITLGRNLQLPFATCVPDSLHPSSCSVCFIEAPAVRRVGADVHVCCCSICVLCAVDHLT